VGATSIDYTDCNSVNQNITREIWEANGGSITFCACTGSITINGGSGTITNNSSCTPSNVSCRCWDINIDPADTMASDDGQVHAMIQCCDGVFQNMALGNGAWQVCLVNLIALQILVGGSYVNATWSVANQTGACGNLYNPNSGIGCNC
jgi:hypothetical protein